MTKAEATAALLAKGLTPRGLTRAEAAAYASVSLRTFQRLCAKGDGPPPAALSCRRKIWTTDVLDAWLAGRRAAAGPAGDPIMDAINGAR